MFPTLVSVTLFPYGEIIWLNSYTSLVAVLWENPTRAKALARTEVSSPLSRADTRRAELKPTRCTLTLVSHGQRDSRAAQGRQLMAELPLLISPCRLCPRDKNSGDDSWLIKLSELVKKAL